VVFAIIYYSHKPFAFPNYLYVPFVPPGTQSPLGDCFWQLCTGMELNKDVFSVSSVCLSFSALASLQFLF